MEHSEKEAYKLLKKLIKLKLPARIDGGGAHWSVEVGPNEGRSLSVDCIWYERSFRGLILGMNPSNARCQLCDKQKPRYGAEFYVVLISDGKQIAVGRTPNREEVVKCVCSWIAGTPLDVLVQNVPFVDERRRTMEAIASHLDPGLVWEIVDNISYELWVYGTDESQRSCRISDESCSFFYGQAQLAYREYSKDITNDVSAWLLDSVPLSLLAERGIQLERHAEVIESDPSRWHWLHMHDRINNPEDVLAPLAPLISALADSPTASKFYTYSSLNRLCFSASSHYPWVGQFPIV
ncbi:MAG TPA: hypothetical protein VHO90_20540, partial [Bacteroidales bacterium]|nr:hypothetical protein [Bacteroidales bacterium]